MECINDEWARSIIRWHCGLNQTMIVGKTWFPSPLLFSLNLCDPATFVFKLIPRQHRGNIVHPFSAWTPDWATSAFTRTRHVSLATLRAPKSRDDTPTEQHKGSVECKQVNGADGLFSREPEQVGGLLNAAEELKRYCWSHLSIGPIPIPALVLILLIFGSIHPPLACLSLPLVYSRLLSAMCSRLAVCPDRPPSSSSSSPPVWCWNSSLDRSPELEDFSSFWMSLLGSASVSRSRQN